MPGTRETGFTITHKFNCDECAWGYRKFLELSELKEAAAGFLKSDTLVLTVDVTVEHEDRFQLDTGAPFLPSPQGVRCHVHR